MRRDFMGRPDPLGAHVGSSSRPASVLKLRSLSRRLREVGPAGWLLLFKTFCFLLAAKVALRWLPMKKIIGWKQRPLKRRGESSEEELLRVRHAVLVVARYSPLRFVCFPQCLAASALLRAEGIESRLHYGVARPDDKLVTHTWLEAGGQIVIGGEVAADYSTLAVY
jgi:Transglutaminase-like superfamily